MPFGIGKGSKGKGKGRGRRRLTGKERLELEYARYVESIRGTPKYEKLMEKRAEKELGLESEMGEIARLAKDLKMLKEAGLVGDATRLGQGNLLEDGLSAIGILGRAFLTGEPPAGVAGLLGSGSSAEDDEAEPEERPAARARGQKKGKPMSIAVWLKAKAIKKGVETLVGDKSPEDAARIFISKRNEYPVIAEMIEGFQVVADNEMDQFMAGLVQEHPEFAATVQWLAERTDWFWHTVYAIRRQLGGQGQGSAPDPQPQGPAPEGGDLPASKNVGL